MSEPLLHWVAGYMRFLLGIVLLVAGVAKMATRKQFTVIVEGYQVVGPAVARGISRLLPEAEVVLAFLLLLGLAVGFAGTAAALLFLVFTAAIIVNLRRGRTDIQCGCFGASPHTTLSWSHAVLNTFLTMGGLLLAALVWRDGPRVATMAGLTPAVVALVTLLSAGLIATALRLSRAGSLARPLRDTGGR